MAESKKAKKTKTCFVIMPISDPDGYEKGHFHRVYTHIIEPACNQTGLSPMRADKVPSTNYIVIDILKRILSSDLCICDLSAKNPNVLFELGIRQAFNLPTVLIKDKQTDRVFDIQGLRTLDYDETLRVDTVQKNVKSLTATISKTVESDPNDVNSLIQLLGIKKAELTSSIEVSSETSIVLEAIKDLSQRMTRIEDKRSEPLRITHGQLPRLNNITMTLPNGQSVEPGELLISRKGGEQLGRFIGVLGSGSISYMDASGTPSLITPKDDRYKSVNSVGWVK